MKSSDQRMIDTQAAIISKNRETAQRLVEDCENLRWRLAERYAERDAWLALQKQIATNTVVQSEWDRFLGFLRLAGDEDYIKVNFREKESKMVDLKKCLQTPGLCSSQDLLGAARHIESFLTIFLEMESLLGSGMITSRLLEGQIEMLRKTAEIVSEREE